MDTYTKGLLKNGAGIYAGIALMKIAKEMKKQEITQQQQPVVPKKRQQAPQKSIEYFVYENAVIKMIGVISSFMEVVLKNGLEVDPFLMREAQDVLNDLQQLIDIGQKAK